MTGDKLVTGKKIVSGEKEGLRVEIWRAAGFEEGFRADLEGFCISRN